ncbi:MAG: EAL domain-containing protein [Planctomycetaceae bacterium]|nr:EAL domain-containing protein [Planctomycetaceae bacterium]
MMLSLNPTAEMSMILESTQPATGWYLSGCLAADAPVTTVPMARLPFIIGRDFACDLTLVSRSVSKRHAEILHTMGAVFVSDLNSTNGTYVNGLRISHPTPVGEYDLIRFADIELQLNRETQASNDGTVVSDVSDHFGKISRMMEVIGKQRMKIYYQPIVAGADAKPFGYEALVRTDVPGLESPLALFAEAEELGLEQRLSAMCRELAMKTIQQARIPGVLFLNTHPHEALDDAMVASLKQLLQEYGPRQIVLEVHEKAVGDINLFRQFKVKLNALGIGLAFDDFGVGQSRLLEIVSVRPDYIKFDRSLVKDLGQPTAMHAGLVASLHHHAAELGIATLAEGLESPEAIAACREIGFGFHQGFAFGKPEPLD